MARPRKEISQKQFEALCGLQCTQQEICDALDVTDKTLNSWCKRTYGAGFSEIVEKKKGIGKISLRRSQWRLAEKNATMAIWLGKQYLGQKEDAGFGRIGTGTQEDALSQSLRTIADDLESDDA